MDYLAPRVIAFGCSFTSYIYPTYADILNAENRAQSGSGNERIFYTALDAYKKGELENYDVVVVQWSSPYRFDYLSRQDWTEPDGNITESIPNKHIWNKIKDWYNPDYEEEKSVNYALTLWHTLQTLNKKIVFLTMSDIKGLDVPILINDIQSKCKVGYRFKDKNVEFVDDHPTIENHISIALRIANRSNFSLDYNRVKQAQVLHAQVLEDQAFGYRFITC